MNEKNNAGKTEGAALPVAGLAAPSRYTVVDGGMDLVVLLVLPGVVGVAGAVVVVVLIGIWVGNDAIVATVHAEVCQNGLHLYIEHIGARLDIFFFDHSLFVFLWITILSSSSLTLDKA